MSIDDFMLPCLNKALFGFECMGCGLQRSAAMVIRGQFVEAFFMYPAIYSLMLLLGVAVTNHFINFKYANVVMIGLAIINVILILGNYILKFI
ncbi:Protein of unknown function [Flavobacteriaceae bacterium MAR_2010_188]|nr:Protein of unknown function [Flavobacteriaceae bacterium MAR_2010_188]